MSTLKRATVYFEPEVHKALRMRAAASDQSISDMVNDAVKASLAEDAVDLAAFDSRKDERSQTFDALVQGMKRRGLRLQSRPNSNRRKGKSARRRSAPSGL